MNEQINPFENNQPFESDIQKIVRRHLQDKNHVITDEEMASVKVGMSTLPDAPTEQAIRNAEDRISDHKADREEDTAPGAPKITPWDTVDPY